MDILHRDALYQIAIRLDYYDLKTFCCLSKRLCRLYQDPRFWVAKLQHDIPDVGELDIKLIKNNSQPASIYQRIRTDRYYQKIRSGKCLYEVDYALEINDTMMIRIIAKFYSSEHDRAISHAIKMRKGDLLKSLTITPPDEGSLKRYLPMSFSYIEGYRIISRAIREQQRVTIEGHLFMVNPEMIPVILEQINTYRPLTKKDYQYYAQRATKDSEAASYFAQLAQGL